ncbi:MAG: hypothetical protein LBQ66_07985 [Planctomycetaceae bacterium]|jgi:hypothetical protein|nr:hypothetical protein [Planctomycetaceae bacterium]
MNESNRNSNNPNNVKQDNIDNALVKIGGGGGIANHPNKTQNKNRLQFYHRNQSVFWHKLIILFGSLTLFFCAVLTNASAFSTTQSGFWLVDFVKRWRLFFSFIGVLFLFSANENFAADGGYFLGGYCPREADTESKNGDIYLSNSSSSQKRNGLFQKFSVSSSWIPSGGDNGLGLAQSDLSMVFAYPLPTVKSPFLVTPSFSHNLFDQKNSSAIDLYSAGVDFRWLLPVIDNKLTLDVAGAVMYNGNFHGETKDAIRFPAHIAAIWNLNPSMKFVFGVAFLDRRNDYNWLPIGGLIWTPNSDINIELLFPRAKIARRLSSFDKSSSMPQEKFSGWVYAAFEFIGGEWTYYEKGISQNINYSDCRFAIGYEQKNLKNMTVGVETGCVVGREFKVKGLPDNEPDTGFFIRLRIVF